MAYFTVRYFTEGSLFQDTQIAYIPSCSYHTKVKRFVNLNILWHYLEDSFRRLHPTRISVRYSEVSLIPNRIKVCYCIGPSVFRSFVNSKLK